MGGAGGTDVFPLGGGSERQEGMQRKYIGGGGRFWKTEVKTLRRRA